MYFTGKDGFVKSQGFKSWQSTLGLNRRGAVSDTYQPVLPIEAKVPLEKANVIFDAQYGLAYVYVAANTALYLPDWTKPPSLERLAPIVESIDRNYLLAAGTGWAARPVADVLVRVPGPDLTKFEGSTYKVVPRSGTPERKAPTENTCGESQTLAKWEYALPAERVASLASENSGDIILLANLEQGGTGHVEADLRLFRRSRIGLDRWLRAGVRPPKGSRSAGDPDLLRRAKAVRT